MAETRSIASVTRLSMVSSSPSCTKTLVRNDRVGRNFSLVPDALHGPA